MIGMIDDGVGLDGSCVGALAFIGRRQLILVRALASDVPGYAALRHEGCLHPLKKDRRV